MRRDITGELRRDLCDPRKVLDALGLLERRSPRQAGGYLVRCPAHGEKTPSCSVQVKGGSLLWHCHGCGAGGDVISLVAAVRGLDTHTQFRGVLRAAAEIAGRRDILATLDGRDPGPRPAPKPRPTPAPATERTYPPAAEVGALWDASVPVHHDAQAASWLASRGLRTHDLEPFDLVRALPVDVLLPRWARSRSGSWIESAHRGIAPLFDARGELRSLRARCVRPGDGPKSLAPSGHSVRGLVLACPPARVMLAHGGRPPWWEASRPFVLVVVEGEVDLLSWHQRARDARTVYPHACIGIEAGAWTAGLASRVPDGASVCVWTDGDAAGARYAAEVADTLGARCTVARGGVS
jgi:hypothetical protein